MTRVEFQFLTPLGEPILNAPFEVQLSKASFNDDEDGILMPRLYVGNTGPTGTTIVDLMPATAAYFVSMYDTESEAALGYKFVVPTMNIPNTVVRLQDLVVDGPISSTNYDEAAIAAIQNAKANALAAQQAAADSAALASSKAQAASGSAAVALTSEQHAKTSETNAKTSETNAKTSETNAATSAAQASAAVTTAVNNLIANAPAALDTLNELASALGNDPNFATTTTTSLANRVRVDAVQALTAGQQAQARSNIGLDQVNNTSDANKPVSTAQAGALALKQPLHKALENKAHSKRITIIGSSSAAGQGATGNNGYMQRLATALAAQGYTVTNVSIGGDNTSSVIARFYNDVPPTRPDIVVIALTLGNEGDTTLEATYKSFVSGMYKLASMCRQLGYVVVSSTSLPRMDYGAPSYQFVRQVNQELEASDIPLLGTSGAVDNWAGNYRAGMWSDSYHCNDNGHESMFRAIPLSFFDRIQVQPYITPLMPQAPEQSFAYNMGTDISNIPLQYIPESNFGSLTVAFWVRRTASGAAARSICSFSNTNNSLFRLRVQTDAWNWAPTLLDADSVDAPVLSSNGDWTHFAIRHDYYSNTQTLFCNGVQFGTTNVNVGDITAVYFGGRPDAPGVNASGYEMSDFAIWRTGLTNEQIAEVPKGRLPKSGLCLYSPGTDGAVQQNTRLINLAPSNTSLKVLIPGLIAVPRYNAQVRATKVVGGNGVTDATSTLQSTGRASFGSLGAVGQYARTMYPDTPGTAIFHSKNVSEALIWGSGGDAYTSFTERMRLSSTGNLGIGTNAPAFRLDVNGDVRSNRQGTQNNLGYKIDGSINGNWAQNNLIGHWYTGTTDAASIRVPSAGDSQNVGIVLQATGEAIINGRTAEYARWDNAGNLLMGTQQIYSQSGIRRYLAIKGSAGAAVIEMQTAYTAGAGNAGVIQVIDPTSSGEKVVTRLTATTEGPVLTDLGGAFVIETKANAGAIAERWRINSSGNMGLGAIPSPWNGAIKGFDLGAYAGFASSSGAAEMYGNGYWAGGATGYVYKNAGAMTIYQQAGGVHRWMNAPAGAAGATIASMTTAMTLDLNGNLGVGTAAPGNYGTLKTVAVGGTQGGVVDFVASAVGVGNNRVAQLYGGKGGFLSIATGASDSLAERLRVDEVGNVLVNKTGLQYPLDGTRRNFEINGATSVMIAGTVGNAAAGYLYSDLTGTELYGDKKLTFSAGGGQRMTLDGTGNLGVGTSTPQARLSLGATTGKKFLAFDAGPANSQSGIGVDMSGNTNELSLFAGTSNGGFGRIAFGKLNTTSGVYSPYGAFDDNGNLLVGVASAGQHAIQKNVTAAGQIILTVQRGDGAAYHRFMWCDSAAWNAANAAYVVGSVSTTGRSINTAGTINASGADYAEYMTKAEGCGQLAKGAIVGVDVDGHLTDKWAAAVSFLIKSTDPSYVGGDVWGSEAVLGMAKPIEPVLELPAYTGADNPGPRPDVPDPADLVDVADKALEQVDPATIDAELLAYDQALATYQADQLAHADAIVAAMKEFNEVTYPGYQAELASFEALLEQARQKVDRMAYCGQVPVNITGGVPGQYVVPIADGDGIAGQLVDAAAVTFEQYRRAVGIVQNILPDGRANVRVKPV